MVHVVLHKTVSVKRSNAKGVTEAEIINVSEYLPYNLWLMFIHGKGYVMMNNILYHDNQSSIRVENNGKNYFTVNFIHINIIYFFIKDRVRKGELKIDYFPTQMVLVEYFTKTLKEKVFKISRDVIMGYKPISSFELIPVSIKERIGNNWGGSKLFLIENVMWNV